MKDTYPPSSFTMRKVETKNTPWFNLFLNQIHQRIFPKTKYLGMSSRKSVEILSICFQKYFLHTFIDFSIFNTNNYSKNQEFALVTKIPTEVHIRTSLRVSQEQNLAF